MKAAAACFVVFIHVGFPGETGQIVKVIARFAVPFFFMISGYFCYYEEKRYSAEKIPLKIRHILRLFLIAVLFYIIWETLMAGLEGKSILSRMQEVVEGQHIKEFVKYNSTSQIRAHLWFLPALFYCYFLDYFIEKFRLRKLAYACIPVLLGVLLWRAEICRIYGWFYHTMEYRNYLYTGMPFYLLGQMIHEYQGKWMKEGKRLQAGIVVGAVISIGEYHWQGAREIYMGTCVMVICLFSFAVLYGRQKAEGILTKTGEKYAFVLYLCHPAVADCAKLLADFLKVSGSVFYQWTRPVIVLSFTVLLIFFMDFLKCRFCSAGKKCDIVTSKPYRK